MPSLDTNVLVRWLIDDDAAQTSQVKKILDTAEDDSLFVPCTVILELEWVLRSRYQFDKNKILQALTALLETRELSLQGEAAIELALYLYRDSTAEFADCLDVGLTATAERSPLLTFDRKAAKLAGVKLIGARLG